jgi:hypothetical protein
MYGGCVRWHPNTASGGQQRADREFVGQVVLPLAMEIEKAQQTWRTTTTRCEDEGRAVKGCWAPVDE